MSLCELCSAIDFTAPPKEDKSFYSWIELHPHNHDIFAYLVVEDQQIAFKASLLEHYKSIDALEASAETCSLCRLIKCCVDASLVNLHKAREMNFTNYEVSGYQFLLRRQRGAQGFQVLGYHPKDSQYLVMGGVRFHVKDESPLASLFRGRMISSSPASPECQTKIKGWIRSCSETHDHKIVFKARLPTRVLGIEHEGHRVVLWDTKEIDVDDEYATLSHCWGGFMPATLNKDTLKELKMGVETTSLPQSFQDAIWVASQLGFQYIWIDSLCILQDDADDWARESERMTEVYQNSCLNISASCANNSRDGFLVNRQQSIYVSIPIGDNNSSGLRGEAFACNILPRHTVDQHRYMDLADEPLSKRGWAMQERYLSRRTLHFTRSQVYFECDEGFYSEDGRRDRNTGYHLEENIIEDGPKPLWYWWAWLDVVMKYSRRKLTIEDDKLPALAGIAKHFAGVSDPSKPSPIPKNHYLAGLWRDDMVNGLIWTVDRGHDQPHRQPLKYRAPSWSWAYVDAPVYFERGYYAKLIVVEDAHTDLDTLQSPYGKVTGGWVCLRALKLRPISLNNHGLFEFDEHGVKFYLYITWDADVYHLPKHGEAEDLAKGEVELFAIPLAWKNNTVDDSEVIFGPFFIVVKAAKRQVARYQSLPHFERVGGGIAQWYHHKLELKRLIQEQWTVAKESDNLERLVLL